VDGRYVVKGKTLSSSGEGILALEEKSGSNDILARKGKKKRSIAGGQRMVGGGGSPETQQGWI